MTRQLRKRTVHIQKEDLENVLDDLDSSFSYSIDGNQMTLTEREYGGTVHVRQKVGIRQKET